MSVVRGLNASFSHEDNGMALKDMKACQSVAKQLNTVIMFRSTGPWSLRWIEKGYPTKNFHAKGKSSDWGPQAGFVPHEGKYSKVGHDNEKARKGTVKNNGGLSHGFINKVQLELSEEELRIQLIRSAKKRTALTAMEPIPGSQDHILRAARTGDNKLFVFYAKKHKSKYQIFEINTKKPRSSALMLGRKAAYGDRTPLYVMSSAESAAQNKPMTGDYDLMAVCPTWGNYGSRSVKHLKRAGLKFTPDGRKKFTQPGLHFKAGVNMDKPLDMRLNTGLPSYKNRNTTFSGLSHGTAWDEHEDMGNVTPRILQCVQRLNSAMLANGTSGAFRRVHHNAESHRNHLFGAITGNEMVEGEGLPVTGFHPAPIAGFDSVVTITTFSDFKAYVQEVHAAGFYVPKNWTWNLSIRNRPGYIGRAV